MKKHLYFHTSNFDQIQSLREDANFKSYVEYNNYEKELMSQYEYGLIETNQNYYHFIFGSPPQKNCPWCSGYLIDFKIDKYQENDISFTYFNYVKLYIECKNCLARSPILNINLQAKEDKKFFEHCKEILLKKWSERIPWDKDFINKYENK